MATKKKVVKKKANEDTLESKRKEEILRTIQEIVNEKQKGAVIIAKLEDDGMAVTSISHEFKVEYMDRVIRTLIEHAHPNKLLDEEAATAAARRAVLAALALEVEAAFLT